MDANDELARQRSLIGSVEIAFNSLRDQVESLYELRNDYSKEWPKSVNLEKMSEDVEVWGKELDKYKCHLSAESPKMYIELSSRLVQIYNILLNNRNHIRNNINHLVFDKINKHALKAAGLN